MTKQVYSIESYQFNSRDGVLFDANIWMYIYGPPSHISSQYRYAYTSALRRIRGAGCPIVLDALVLSEFINAYARFFYNKLPTGNKPTDYKLFLILNQLLNKSPVELEKSWKSLNPQEVDLMLRK
jgi:hypothetical protein